jgi:hypothetical protein
MCAGSAPPSDRQRANGTRNAAGESRGALAFSLRVKDLF